MNFPDSPTIPTKENVRGRVADFGRAHPELIRLELFGFLARGEANEASDIDLVVTFAKT